MKKTLLISVVILAIAGRSFAKGPIHVLVSAVSHDGKKVASIVCDNSVGELYGQCIIVVKKPNEKDASARVVAGMRLIQVIGKSIHNTIRFSADNKYIIYSQTAADKTQIGVVDITKYPLCKDYIISHKEGVIFFALGDGGEKGDVMILEKDGISFYEGGLNCNSSKEGVQCTATLYKKSYAGKAITTQGKTKVKLAGMK